MTARATATSRASSCQRCACGGVSRALLYLSTGQLGDSTNAQVAVGADGVDCVTCGEAAVTARRDSVSG